MNLENAFGSLQFNHRCLPLLAIRKNAGLKALFFTGFVFNTLQNAVCCKNDSRKSTRTSFVSKVLLSLFYYYEDTNIR